MKLIRIVRGDLPAKEIFTFSEKPLQGATVGKFGDALYILSPRRYKLFTEHSDEIHILEGNGHFKWARGETPFSAGQSFFAEGLGEYEVNGNCTFIVCRRT